MTRSFVLALVCAMLACGGGDTPAPDLAEADFEAEDGAGHDESEDGPDYAEGSDGGNQPPLVGGLKIVPSAPKSGDTLTVTMKIVDKEGDPVDIAVDWYKNGQLVKSGSSTRFDGDGLRRGDQVYAEVTVSDAFGETYEETAVVTLENRAPTVRNARIVPVRATGGDTLLVEADAADPDGDSFEFSYAWTVDDEPRPEFNGASLPAGSLKRGQRVQVAVTATDGAGQSALFRTPPIELANAKPRITSKPSDAGVSAGRYSYQLAAEDPDGDRPLRYALVEGPNGLDVDLLSGLVTWDVPEGEGGKFPVVVSVSDAHGGQHEQSYTVELNWGAPASAEEPGSEPAAEESDEDASEAP